VAALTRFKLADVKQRMCCNLNNELARQAVVQHDTTVTVASAELLTVSAAAAVAG